MKKLFFMTLAAAMPLMALFSCTKDDGRDDDIADVPQSVLVSFGEQFPGATDVSWSTKGNYWVASFNAAPVKSAEGNTSAWFDYAGKLWMTESDSTEGALPQAVKDAIAASEYAGWRIEDVDIIFRNGVEKVYVVEVEGRLDDGREVEVDLYYLENGTLMKKVVDADDDYDYGDFIPSELPVAVKTEIDRMYPGAQILDVDKEYGGTEVEILDVDANMVRELFFDRTDAWKFTETEVRMASVPENVKAVLAQKYPGYFADDEVKHFKTSEGKEFYRFELESATEEDIEVDIDTEGNVTVVPDDDDDHDGGSPSLDRKVTEFIADKYPGAAVLDKDYSDGYLEVEIRHEGKEKDVYFNGALDWVMTEWDVLRAELPAAVAATLDRESAGWEIDDITFTETPSAGFYQVELENESTDQEKVIRIDGNGNLL